jgi:hypothetical protein
VSVVQLVAIARRHVFAVSLILLVTAGIAIDFRYTQPTYTETATVALEPESFASVQALNVDQDFLQNSSLIATCQLLVMHLSGPQGGIQLRKAGITGDFAVSVVNDSNADTPAYPYPDLSVSVTDTSPSTTHSQFAAATQVISADIANFQAGDQISAQDRFTTYTLSDSGPVSQRGSLVRAYAALMFLALVAMFLTCRFLDRRARDRAIPAAS